MNNFDYSPIDQFFAADDGLVLRLGALVFVLLVFWRFIYLTVNEPPATTTSPLPLTSPSIPLSLPPPRSWFPSRKERLELAIELVRTETDHLLAQTDATKATAGLAQARAELASLLQEIEPAELPRPLPPSALSPALTLRQFEQVIEFSELSLEDRRRLTTLIAARLEECHR